MEEYQVVFRDFEDIRKFVRAAEQCDYDVDVYYNHIQIDGKSLLGIINIGIGKKVKVICFNPCETLYNVIKTLQPDAE